MRESVINSWEELKRVDHLIYVSLKYTRTVDVIKSIVERLINAYDFLMQAILEKAEEENKITEVPKMAVQRVTAVHKLYPYDQKMNSFLDFYMLLRKIVRAKTSARSEFRRHVTMTVEIDEGKIEIDIDIIHEYFDHTKEFFEYIKSSNYI